MTNSHSKRSLVPRVLIGCVTVCGLLIAAAFCYVQSVNRALPELRTVRIERRDLVITIGTTGTIEPQEVVQVGPDVAGKIVSFGKDPENLEKSIGVGARVTQGTVLFQLDVEQYELSHQKATAAYRLAEADIARLEAQLQQAVRSLDRANQLRATNTQSAYDEIATGHEMAVALLAVGRARLEQAATEVRHAEINLKNTSVRSPIDGVVIDRRANLGQYVNIGHPGLFLLSKDLDHMRIRASVSESDVGKVKLGQVATFEVDAHRDIVMTGHVDEILLNARRQGNFVTYDVIVSIDRTDIELLPHMTADVEFEIVRRNRAWLVPSGSLQWWPAADQIAPATATMPLRLTAESANRPSEGDSAYVWIPTSDGKVRALSVQVGVDDGVQTEVIGKGFKEELPIVVGVVHRTTLARIIPTAKTLR